jgi:prepilin-type N-terminal cleavage/methylation domain-containing protein/prepilin-type processing-associated H-X9-DG protein
MNRPPRANAPSAGFTLVELLVVIAIIALLLTLVTPTLFKGRDEANNVACKQKLSEIGKTFMLYRSHHEDKLPSASGIRFVLAPWKAKEIDNNERYAKIYQCPGDRVDSPLDDETKELRITDVEQADSSMISYSGRDTRAFPIRYSDQGTQLLVCDDDENEPNHPLGVNVLYADGTVDFFSFEKLGLANPDEFRVGADSPNETFRVLTNE